MSANQVIDVVHRLATLPAFSQAAVESMLNATLYPIAHSNPELAVATAALDDGPFATVELVTPGPYSRLVERRIVLTPSGELPFAELAAWYGPGTPLHLDGRAEQPIATVLYDVDGKEVSFSFDVNGGEVRYVTVAHRAAAG